MKTYILSAFLLGICFTACTTGQPKDYPSFSLEDISAIKPDTEYPLDSLVTDMEVIPLETTDDCLIDGVGIVQESKDYYFIFSPKKESLLKFDKKGKFISKISSYGQGPKEFIDIKQMELDNDRQELYIMDYMGRKMKIFDFDGNFLRYFPLPEDYSFTNFHLSPTEQAVYYVSSNNAVTPDLLKYDIKSGTSQVLSKHDREMEIGEAFLGSTYFTETDAGLFMYHYYNDMVFLLKDNQLVPNHLLVLGDRCIPWEDVGASALTNPKPQVLKIQLNDLKNIKDKICLFYTVTRYDGKSRKDFMAMYNPEKEGIYPHVNLVSNRFLSIKDAAPFTNGYNRESIFRVISPESLDETFLNRYGITEDDNPVIVKYLLR